MQGPADTCLNHVLNKRPQPQQGGHTCTQGTGVSRRDLPKPCLEAYQTQQGCSQQERARPARTHSAESHMLAACLSRTGAHQVKPAAMNVDDWPQQLADHGAALQVPPRAPLSPGALPGGLPRLCCLPERKVGRAALAAVYSYPFTRPVVVLHQKLYEAAVQRS